MSLLRRLGIKADCVSESELSDGVMAEYRALIVPEAAHLLLETRRAIERWSSVPGRWLIVSGSTNLSEGLLGVRRLGVLLPESFLSLEEADEDAGPVSCPGYEVQRVEAGEGGKEVSSLSELCLEGNPSIWVRKSLDLPAVIVTDRTLYFTFPFFGYVGGALQAHLSIEPVRGSLGSDGIFYLDRLAAWFSRVLRIHAPSPCWVVRLHPWGRHPSALVFRHDTDHSRDTSYLDYEVAHQLPATYAVLPDENRAYWLERLAPHSFIEASFHYRTNRERKLFRLFRPGIGYQPDRRAITGRGLVRQARAAVRAKIPIATLHRHAPFFCYPESIDALDALYRKFPEIVGSGSMFRWTIFRYLRSLNHEAYTVLHPETSVPFWFPFRLVVSAVQKYEVLSGWESTHVLEPDPWLLHRLFQHADAYPGGGYTVGYHPAHARCSTFNPDGNFDWFVLCAEEAKRRDWWVTTCSGLYRRVAHWESLKCHLDAGRARILNPTGRVFVDAVLRTPDGDHSLGDVEPGEEKEWEW
jgi:hypothetical protein